MLEVDKDFDVCNKLETNWIFGRILGKVVIHHHLDGVVMVISFIRDKCILYKLQDWENFGANNKAVSWIVSWRYSGEEYIL